MLDGKPDGVLEKCPRISPRNCAIAVVPPHGTSLLPATRQDSPVLAKAHGPGPRCPGDRTRQHRAYLRALAFADERSANARGPAVNVHAPSGDPVAPVARQRDGHARRCRVIRRPGGGSRNGIHRYIEWTF